MCRLLLRQHIREKVLKGQRKEKLNLNVKKKKKKREFKFQRRREKDGKSRDYGKGISNTEKMRRKRHRMKKVWQEEDEVAAQ